MDRIEDLRLAASAIRTYMPDTLPADKDGKIHFARALAEAAAAVIEAHLDDRANPATKPTAWLVKLFTETGMLLDTRLEYVKPYYGDGRKAEFVALWEEPPRPEVKQLAWRKGYCDEVVTITQATTIGGNYQIRVLQGTVWLDMPEGKGAAEFPSTDDAIEAAQIDHERRVWACFNERAD